MAVSIVIPAHNEENVLERCLNAVLTGAQPDELHIVVVCNGCSDRTADVARTFGDRVTVIETVTPSKANALNLGDEAARGFPRFYIDADVVLTLPAIRCIAARMKADAAPAAAPGLKTDLSGSSWPVRAYYAVWTRLPYVSEGMMGVGVYALSEAGRARFGRFPDIIADDGYVRSLFRAAERVRVDDAPVRVIAPASLASLVGVQARSRLGGYEFAQKFPELAADERQGKDYGSAVRMVARRPGLWPHVLVYVWVNLQARLRARRELKSRATYVWERDLTSRQAGRT